LQAGSNEVFLDLAPAEGLSEHAYFDPGRASALGPPRGVPSQASF
jgi:hypothetical protein